jgi:hypothetical protein
LWEIFIEAAVWLSSTVLNIRLFSWGTAVSSEQLSKGTSGESMTGISHPAGRVKTLCSRYIARMKHWTGIDRAIAFTVLARAWSSLAGVVTVLLIARFLTPVEQGYYYTFFSLVALQVVFELGFAFVIIQMAAHERAALTLTPEGSLTGAESAHSRLASVLQTSVRWYTVVAIVMLATLLPAGLHFFGVHQQPGMTLGWRAPWTALVVATALTFQLDPVCAFLEGCGFVSNIAHMRLLAALLGSVLAWTAMLTHHGLFAPALLIFGNATVQIGFLSQRPLRRLLAGLLKRDVVGNVVSWRREIWPFQWRIAVTWLASYFTVQLINPILFLFRGPIAAGRMGMSLSIANSIGTVGLAWMSTKAAPFGNLIARGETSALDSLFFRTLWQSIALLSAACVGFFTCLVIGGRFLPHLAARVLPNWAFALLLAATILNHIFFSEALYLRAHKREPMLVQAVVVAVLMAISTFISAKFWAASGITVGYFLFAGVLSVAWGTRTFLAKRREWYGEPQSHDPLYTQTASLVPGGSPGAGLLVSEQD